MTKTTRILTALVLGLGLASFVSSCEKGPAEKAGEKIDNAVKDTKDAVKETAQDIKDKANKK